MNKFLQTLANIIFVIFPLAGAAWGGFHFFDDVNRRLIIINQQPIGEVQRVERIVQRQLSSRTVWEQASGGLPLYPGDKIRTGDDSAVRISISSGDVIDMGANSFITMSMTAAGASVDVERGVVIPVVSSGSLSMLMTGGSVLSSNDAAFTNIPSLDFSQMIDNVVISAIQPTVSLSFSDTFFASDASFSPNGDGVKDTLPLFVGVPSDTGISGWALIVLDERGGIQRTYSSADGTAPPSKIEFDGKNDRGRVIADGIYHWQLSVRYRNGYLANAISPAFSVDSAPPAAQITPQYTTFSPNNDGKRDTIIFNQMGSREVSWTGEIRAANAEPGAAPVRNIRFTGALPQEFSWNGMTDGGSVAPDGEYTYRVSCTDQAGNSMISMPVSFTLSTADTPVKFTAGAKAFSPTAQGAANRIILTPEVAVVSGLLSWSAAIVDAAGNTVRTFSGSGRMPASLSWDGRTDEDAKAPDGLYTASLVLRYEQGNEPEARTEPFVLDTVPPRAAFSVPYTAFSPNGDGIREDIPIVVTTEGNDEWQARIADRQGKVVRAWAWKGSAPSVVWDGRDGAGNPLPDGDYRFSLSAVDEAGNTGVVPAPLSISMSRADTPVRIAADKRAFSPGSAGSAGTIAFRPQAALSEGITSWQVDMLNTSGVPVRSFTGTGALPASLSWDGKATDGSKAPDGTYRAGLQVRYDMGNEPSSVSEPFVIDTLAPVGDVSVPYTMFSPNADGQRDTLPINVRTEGADRWTAAITSESGKEVRAWNWTGRAPELIWDGRDQSGARAADGAYRFSLNSSDEAGNRFTKTIDGIRMDSSVPRLSLTSSAQAIGSRRWSSASLVITATHREGVELWRLDIKDERGETIRSFSGTETLPAQIVWDGRNAAGVQQEGSFTPQLIVQYTKGDRSAAQAMPITIDTAGPVLSFSSSPEYFSPDNDGENDVLTINLGAKDASGIADWSFEIREPQPPHPRFYRVEGKGAPSPRMTWNGRSQRGELVQAATDYPYTYTVTDILGNTSKLEGHIGVDVLVIRDGDQMRLNVPSIVFRSDNADFNGLSQDVVNNNNRILRRIAQILNKFPEYRVRVEGHANPVIRTQAEQDTELQPLSERRARAVVDFLVNFGVNRGRLSSVGVGGSRPVAAFEDRNNWWKNRRVEFILIR